MFYLYFIIILLIFKYIMLIYIYTILDQLMNTDAGYCTFLHNRVIETK